MVREFSLKQHKGFHANQILSSGNMLISTGDTGRAHIWAYVKDQGWAEFADFGPEDQIHNDRLI